MKGFTIAEQGHVILGIAPKGTCVVAATTSDTFFMGNWAHASILVAGGVGSTASAVTVGECTGFGGTGRTALSFWYAKEDGTAGDVLDAALAYGSTVTFGATAAVFIVIEIDADELSDGYPYVQYNIATTANKDVASFVILSGARYAEDITATAIA
jgi:hypothetical protein